MKESLLDYFDEFTAALKEQLLEDEKRWGDTWIKRGLTYEGKTQEQRFYDWIDDIFFLQLIGDCPFPWLKVAGEAMIGYIRERYMKGIK